MSIKKFLGLLADLAYTGLEGLDRLLSAPSRQDDCDAIPAVSSDDPNHYDKELPLVNPASGHVMVGGIDAANTVSIRLHERLGFTHCGTVSQAGFKFGRWLDLAFYQKILETPAAPADG